MAIKLVGKSIDYAFSALQHIKEQEGRKVLASEIARENGIPEKYLSKILRTLVRANIIRSHYGPAGGYAMARKPGEITFKDVLDAVSGGFFIVDCLDRGAGRCTREDKCTHKNVWRDVHMQIDKLLRSRTLRDI